MTDEISNEVEKGNNNGISTHNALIAIIAALVVMSGVQVFQTQKLLAAVSSGAVKATSQTQAPNNSIGLPSQVGGCG